MAEQYDMIVIGAGAAGLTASAFAGGLDTKVALIERDKLGGDCTWVGCIPSKALLHIARTAHAARTADKYGITVSEPQVDMSKVRDHIKRTIDEIYQHETPEVFSERGVDVIKGEARFTDPHTIQVGDRQLTSKRIVIATGGRPAVPAVPGIEDVPYHTNATLFDNDRLPQRLIVMGAGPIGMEMGQAYARLGAQVTIFGGTIMPRDEPEAVDVLKTVFEREGIRLIESLAESFSKDGETIVAKLNNGEELRGDMLLVAAGRAPNVDTLDLEKAGVAYTPEGITVDQHLRTNIPHIYAIGDVTTSPKFTHYAGFQGAIAARNSLFPVINSGGHEEVLPWVTYTDPEIAHVGMTEAEARAKFGAVVKTFTLPMSEGDRAVAEDDTEGFIKLVYKGSGELLGATVVADRAGELLVEYSLIIKKVASARDIIGVMHAYPTYSDIARKAVSKMMVNELFDSTPGKIIKQVVRAVK